jgi:dienelactone hydrolase
VSVGSRRVLVHGLLGCVGLLLGCGNDAPPTAPLDLDANGPYQSMQRTVMIDPPEGDPDSIQGNLWLPTSETDARPAAGFPLVAFLPASTTTGLESYQALLGHIASHGYAVLAVNLLDQGDDPTRQINRLWHAVSVTLEQGAAMLDAEQIVLIGHSIGGKIALLAASLDHPLRDKVLTVIAWDPVDFMNARDTFAVSVTPEYMPDVHVPVLIFGTPLSDCVLEGDSHQEFFAEARPGSLHLFFPTADHVDWADDFGEGVFGYGIARDFCHLVGELNGYTVHRVTRRSQVAWLYRHVNNKPDMDRYLTGADAPEIDRGVVIATEK